jgi:hypothetical protein
MADKTVTLKIKVDGQELDVAKENIQQFDSIIKDAQTKLSTMKVGSEEWKKLSDELQNAEAAFKATKEEAGNADTKFKSLRTQIRETTVAMQALEDAGQSNTKEFEQLRAKLDNLNDTQERAAFKAGQLDDKLSAMPGVAGRAGRAFKSINDSVNQFGKTTTLALGTVGLIVAAFGFLVKAIQNNDGAMKKFQPLLIKLEQLLNGVVEAMMPLIDLFIEFADWYLPKITGAFKILYSVIAAVGQTLAGFVGAVKKAMSGDFSGAWEDAKKSVNDFGDNYDAANKRFEEGTKQTTKIEQAELDKRAEARKAYNEKITAANEALRQIELEMLKERNLEIANENIKHEKNIEAVKILGSKAIETEKKRHIKALEDIDEKYRKIQFEKEMKYLQDFNNAMQTNLTDKYNIEIRNAQLIQKNRQLQNKETIEDEIKTFTAIRALQATMAEDVYKKKRDDYENARDLMDKAGADEIQFEKDTQYILAQMDRNRALEKINFNIETYQILGEINKKAKDKEKEELFDMINYEITMLDKLSAEREFDFEDDIKRNNHKIEELKRLQQIEEDAAKGQADVLLKIKRDYSDKINKIEVDNVNLVRMAEDQKMQIRLAYAQAAQQIGTILQQLAGQNADLAIAGIYIEKAAALVSIGINAQRNFVKDGGATSPLAWANLAVAAVSAATVIAQAAKGIIDINSARNQGSSTSSTAGGNQYADGSFRGYAEGGLIGGRRHAQGGTMIEAEAGEAVMTRGAVTLFAPLLSTLNQMGGGTSFGSTMVSTYDKPVDGNNTSEQAIIKTYVVEGDLTSAQHRQARLKNLSTL